jgi:hypothetical protein
VAFRQEFPVTADAFRNEFPNSTHCTRVVITDPYRGEVYTLYIHHDDFLESFMSVVRVYWINGYQVDMDTNWLVNEAKQREYREEEFKKDHGI